MNESITQNERVSPKRTSQKVRLLLAEDLLERDVTRNSNTLQLPIQQIEIEGLLSFGKNTKFAFGRLNILVGPNGSGKSNLIDCLRILQLSTFDIQEAFKDTGFEDWLYRGVNLQNGRAFLQVIVGSSELPAALRHQVRLGPPLDSRAFLEEVISSAELESGQLAAYFVGSHRSGATISVAGSGKRRRERKLGPNEYNPLQSILSQVRDVEQFPEISRLATMYSKFRIYSEWTFGRNSRLREATSAGRSDVILSESMNDLALALNGLEKTAAHDKIRVLLMELKDTYRDYVTRVLFGKVGLELVEAPFDSPLPAKRLSDGTLRFLALAAILLQANPPPLICLEEPELGMHPDMIRMVAGMIIEASNKTQLIVTTHSEQLLTALQDNFDALFAFDAGPNGSVVHRLSREEYLCWRVDHDLGELWSSGEIGGVRY